MLQREPTHLLLCSDGTSFVRVPDHLKFIQSIGSALVNRKSSEAEIRQLLKRTFDNTQNRHAYAGWWGLKQLWWAHTMLFEDLKENLNTYVLGQNIFSHSMINSLSNRICEYIYQLSPKPRYFNWDKEEIYVPRNKNPKKKVKVKLKDHIHELRETIVQQKLKVLHIDDQWDTGWSKIFAHILHGKMESNTEDDHFYTFNDGLFTVAKEIKEQRMPNIIQQIEITNPDLIFLDLRLFSC